jgi:hypothetical protein
LHKVGPRSGDLDKGLGLREQASVHRLGAKKNILENSVSGQEVRSTRHDHEQREARKVRQQAEHAQTVVMS